MITKTYRALLIANSEYPADRNLAPLEGARNDPALLRDALCDDSVGLIPSDNIRLVQERESAAIRKEIELFFQSATSDDLLVLYYSGHGALNFRNELFFCARDTDLNHLRSTSVPATDVRLIIDDSRVSSTVVLLDCCHSGRFKNAPSGLAIAGEGTFVVTSSRPGELADDTDQANRASRFTHHLVQALRFGAGDEDEDGLVTVNDVYNYVHETMSESAGPVPQRHFSGNGVVPLARRQQSAPLPEPATVDEVPELDVPFPRVDLGVVESGVEIPVERVAVVNRGGGILDWTCESPAEWVRAERDGNELALHLTPGIGKHLANVYVRDATAREVKTVRVSVEVREVEVREVDVREVEVREDDVPEKVRSPHWKPPGAVSETIPDEPAVQGDNEVLRSGKPGENRFAAGWYEDTSGRFEYRYYDGRAWTDTVATQGNVSSDPVSAGSRDAARSAPRHTRRIRAVVYFVVSVSLALTMIAGIAEMVDPNSPYEYTSADFAIAAVLVFVAALIFWRGVRAWKRTEPPT